MVLSSLNHYGYYNKSIMHIRFIVKAFQKEILLEQKSLPEKSLRRAIALTYQRTTGEESQAVMSGICCALCAWKFHIIWLLCLVFHTLTMTLTYEGDFLASKIT